MGDVQQARSSALLALDLAGQTGSPALQARAHHQLAHAMQAESAHQEALSHWDQSLELLRNSPDSRLQWQVLHGKGLSEAALGQSEAAMRSLEQAIEWIERVRDRLQQEHFRAGYIQDKYQVYVDLVRLQLQQGMEARAFSTAERLRSQRYTDLLYRDIPISGASPEAREEERLQARIKILREALRAERSQDQSGQRQPAVTAFSRELLEAENDYQDFIRKQSRSRPDRAGQAPAYADVSGRLGPREALLEYVVGEEFLVVFLLTPDKLHSRVIEIERVHLDNKVELVRNLISRRDADRWRKPALSLSSKILHPLMAHGMLEPVEHLFVVPHGTLNYLPFALMPLDQDEYLVDRFTISHLPTAAALLLRAPGTVQSTGMLSMAPERSRLQFAQDEVQMIQSLVDQPGKALLGKEATESAFKREAPDFRYVHLATHGYFNKLNPMLSGLELEPDKDNDGLLELHEVLRLELQAELVTLSACQTGLGAGHFAEIPAGDDFVGMTRAFLSAGSDSVLASLWEVDDESTMSLMTQFYRRLDTSGPDRAKAEALAQSQRVLKSTKKYSHPYYWAPFVLVGESAAGDPATQSSDRRET